MHIQLSFEAGNVIRTVRRKINPELCTQAWCKFYEILTRFPQLTQTNNSDEFKSLHLCEAPGAFITSLNHYLTLQLHGLSAQFQRLELSNVLPYL